MTDDYDQEADSVGSYDAAIGAMRVRHATKLQAPFPWFGGKSRVTDVVWRAFGDIGNYVEPFFGSGAVLLGRPRPFKGIETINDIDGLVSNFWRSIIHSPDEVARWADWPVNENDLHARHVWLLGQMTDLVSKLEGNPEYHDTKIAGYWVWGICCWIGGEFCSGKGPWQVNDSGQLVQLGGAGQGVNRGLVHLGNAGRGVNRKRVHLGCAGQGVNRQLVHLGPGRGVNRVQQVGVSNLSYDALSDWFASLSERLRYVRVCSGDWSRVCGPTPTFKQGLTGVFLDPPYADTAGRTPTIYRNDSGCVAHDVREWAIESGKRDDMRIALCGYEGEHVVPSSWVKYEWKTQGGYANLGDADGKDNCKRERIWFSPSCLPVDSQMSLFDFGTSAE